jgi:hypothetical protein
MVAPRCHGGGAFGEKLFDRNPIFFDLIDRKRV